MTDTADALGTALFLGLLALAWGGIALRAWLSQRRVGQ